jgi:ribonuclease HI
MKPTKGIIVDGSSRGNPGESSCRGIDLETKVILFELDLGISTNNVAEFCGLVYAIKYALDNGYTSIYSDSVTAIAWARNKKHKSTLVRNTTTAKSLDAMDKCVAYLLKTNTTNYSHFIKKWETKKWGENPADYGFK